MKIFLRIVGITSILLAWGITAFMSFTFSGANLNQLQRLSWNVLEMEIKNDFLDDRLYFTADAAVATPFWRHVSWAQKAMDRAESLNSSDFKLDEKLREGVLSTGAFDRQGSQKISWFYKRDPGLENEMVKLVNSLCPLENDTTAEPHTDIRKHPKTKLLFRFKPDTVSSYKSLLLIVLNDDVTDNIFSAVVFVFDYDYAIDQTKDCLNHFWASQFNRIFTSVKGVDYGIKIRDGQEPIFIWGSPDSIVTVEHQMNVKGETRKKKDKIKVARGKNAVLMFNRPARLYIDWGVVARSQGEVAETMSKISGVNILWRTIAKTNLITSVLMTLGVIAVLISVLGKKKKVENSQME